MSYEGAITPAKITLKSDTTRTDGQNLELDGWTDVQDGSTKKWEPSAQRDISEREATLYAVWKNRGKVCPNCNKLFTQNHYFCRSCNYCSTKYESNHEITGSSYAMHNVFLTFGPRNNSKTNDGKASCWACGIAATNYFEMTTTCSTCSYVEVYFQNVRACTNHANKGKSTTDHHKPHHNVVGTDIMTMD